MPIAGGSLNLNGLPLRQSWTLPEWDPQWELALLVGSRVSTNITMGWKGMGRANTLAYSDMATVTPLYILTVQVTGRKGNGWA